MPPEEKDYIEKIQAEKTIVKAVMDGMFVKTLYLSLLKVLKVWRV